MSVVIGIKENNTVYLGADSQVTRGWTKYTLSNKNNYKIWSVKNTQNVLMGTVGSVREANVISTSNSIVDELKSIKNEVDFSYVVNTVVPNMFAALKNAGVISTKEGQPLRFNNSYLLATKDKLFVIDIDGCVVEIDDYIAIGSGEDYAITVLNSTVGQNPKDRIISAIKSTAQNHIYVNYPIVIADTESMDFDVING